MAVLSVRVWLTPVLQQPRQIVHTAAELGRGGAGGWHDPGQDRRIHGRIGGLT